MLLKSHQPVRSKATVHFLENSHCFPQCSDWSWVFKGCFTVQAWSEPPHHHTCAVLWCALISSALGVLTKWLKFSAIMDELFSKSVKAIPLDKPIVLL